MHPLGNEGVQVSSIPTSYNTKGKAAAFPFVLVKIIVWDLKGRPRPCLGKIATVLRFQPPGFCTTERAVWSTSSERQRAKTSPIDRLYADQVPSTACMQIKSHRPHVFEPSLIDRIRSIILYKNPIFCTTERAVRSTSSERQCAKASPIDELFGEDGIVFADRCRPQDICASSGRLFLYAKIKAGE